MYLTAVEGLLAYRIRRFQKTMTNTAVRRDLSPIIVIVVESGAINAIAVLILLIVYAARSWAESMVLDILPSLIVSPLRHIRSVVPERITHVF